MVLSKVSLQRERFDGELPASLSTSITFKLSRVRYEDSILQSRGSFSIHAHGADEPNDDRFFSLLFDLDLLYSTSGFHVADMSETELGELLDAFQHRNVALNVWPYAREFVSSMTVRMGFPALVLSTLKVIR